MRSDISSSRLVRLLGAWAPLEGQASRMDFAERLGLWVSAFDAMALQAAHQSIHAITSAAAAKPLEERAHQDVSVTDDFQRVRSALAHAIAQDPLAFGNARSAPPASHALDTAAASYAPYRQRHLKLQHEMTLMIAPLRDHVRQTLSRVSPRLRQLAALDAVFEHQLAPREQLLMPTAAALMKRRFDQLRLAHGKALSRHPRAGEEPEVAGALDSRLRGDDKGSTISTARAPAQARAPGHWLDVFLHDWRQALLAELDLRLEPVAGLIDALNNEMKNQE